MTVTSQRAAIAVKLLGPLREEAKRRQEATSKDAPRDSAGHLKPVVTDSAQPDSGRAVEHASKIVGVGKTTIQLAKAVHDADPKLERAARPANQAAEEAAPLPQLWMREDETGARLTVNALLDFEAPPVPEVRQP